ncbi:hypothetical protein M427DRAFT_57958 [Gonapodya prolifera JEL478]|uniref:Uncharacterized protein n=1 Tax=Gonapodya prolifera (strain JEL478) TaxID=1344416 RepID=A0A139AAW7_GONPJ|nr:hypothetical protein M427DRAFT_57958 [Gonapodya prolifera JEL478]|eukprot:KXS13946.1 hypothetical protein M427DRAFT_57958 [Gonapodya prolifera JEL478]
MKDFYTRVAKGPAPPLPPTRNLIELYVRKYMTRGQESGVPLLHLLLLIIPTGYIIKSGYSGHIHPNREFH